MQENLTMSLVKTYFIIFKMNICFTFFWSYSYRFLMIISGYVVSFRATELIGDHFVFINTSYLKRAIENCKRSQKDAMRKDSSINIIR